MFTDIPTERALTPVEQQAEAQTLSPQGDFDTFYKQVDATVRRIAEQSWDHATADDIAQTTFEKAYTQRERFRSDSSASTWVARIAYNASADQGRATQRRPQEQLNTEKDYPSLTVQSAETSYFEQDATASGVNELLDTLNEDQRDAVRAIILGDMSLLDYANATGIPIATIKTRLHRAKRKMQTHLTTTDIRL
jgi:RNA polymerase sigma-70 factor (ECF subfamily)